MNEQERIDLEIEKTSYQEVIKQMSKGCDARMETGLNEFLSDIETKIEQINKKLNADFGTNKENEIRDIANKIWLEAGSPDGERLVSHYGKLVPLKEVHWAWAENEWKYGPDYLKSY